MTADRLHRWMQMVQPRGNWRRRARVVMARIIEDYLNTHADVDIVELTTLVDEAYPFGPRSHAPYKAWLEERRLLREHMLEPERPGPDAEERAVLEVAADLVEEGRTAAAAALVEEQAPNRHGKHCPTCKALVGEPCWDFDAPSGASEVFQRRIVPHHARLAVPEPERNEADFGPLFGGSP